MWSLWVLQPSHTCRLPLFLPQFSKNNKMPSVNIIEVWLPRRLLFIQKTLCSHKPTGPLFKPICLSGWGWDCGPLGVGPTTLLWHRARCGDDGEGQRGVRHEDLAGAALRAESAVEKLRLELSGFNVLNDYGAMGQQRLGPNGSGGGAIADKPTTGTKTDRATDLFILSPPLSPLFLSSFGVLSTATNLELT